MIIALDFDDTYTRDPDTWDKFVLLMQDAGHTIVCVTMRTEAEGQQVRKSIGRLVDSDHCFFTSRQAKKPFMERLGVNINVWIDDNPFWILHDARG